MPISLHPSYIHDFASTTASSARTESAWFLQYYSVRSKGLSDFLAQNARNRAACPLPAGRFRRPAHDRLRAACRTDVIGWVPTAKGGAPGGPIPWSRDTCKVGPQGCELA